MSIPNIPGNLPGPYSPEVLFSQELISTLHTDLQACLSATVNLHGELLQAEKLATFKDSFLADVLLLVPGPPDFDISTWTLSRYKRFIDNFLMHLQDNYECINGRSHYMKLLLYLSVVVCSRDDVDLGAFKEAMEDFWNEMGKLRKCLEDHRKEAEQEEVGDGPLEGLEEIGLFDKEERGFVEVGDKQALVTGEKKR